MFAPFLEVDTTLRAPRENLCLGEVQKKIEEEKRQKKKRSFKIVKVRDIALKKNEYIEIQKELEDDKEEKVVDLKNIKKFGEEHRERKHRKVGEK